MVMVMFFFLFMVLVLVMVFISFQNLHMRFKEKDDFSYLGFYLLGISSVLNLQSLVYEIQGGIRNLRQLLYSGFYLRSTVSSVHVFQIKFNSVHFHVFIYLCPTWTKP